MFYIYSRLRITYVGVAKSSGHRGHHPEYSSPTLTSAEMS
jgi:hypothetical protein